ncbi:MAG TPA: glycosyltransferase family 2 protein [Hyphomonadaceae bacterium]|nr:glycosyltransferase family 2 protein [Hyphomonadaceae bacterium]
MMDTTITLDAQRTKPQSVNAPAVVGADVLVVIPVLNEASHIEACIRSLMTGDIRLRDARFVVTDGGSRDATREIVESLRGEFPNLGLLANPKKLQSAAVNIAAREAGDGQRILVRCDAHAIYPANYVMMVADSLGQRGIASVVVPMDAVGKSCFQKANAWIVDTPLGSGGSAHRGGRKSMFVDHGHHAGFDLKTFLQVGGYDETFSHNEDAEFDTRLRKAGGQIYLDADIRLVYLPRATVPSLARQYFNYGKGRARTLMKHGEHPKLRQLIPPATLVACLTGFALAPFNPLALIIPGGYLAALALASIAVAVKHKSLCGLMAGLASATMHMSWSAGFFRQMLKGQKL